MDRASQRLVVRSRPLGNHARKYLRTVERHGERWLDWVHPDDRSEIRDRGLLRANLGQSGAAIADLETYLALAPTAPDADSVRGRVTWLRRRMSELN